MNLLLKNYKYKYVILLTILDILLLFYYILVYTLNISLKQIKKYIKENLNGILHYDKSQLTKNNNPIISIIISTFNGEIYLKPVIRSVQNQNFLNIEIIIVDDSFFN